MQRLGRRGVGLHVWMEALLAQARRRGCAQQPAIPNRAASSAQPSSPTCRVHLRQYGVQRDLHVRRPLLAGPQLQLRLWRRCRRRLHAQRNPQLGAAGAEAQAVGKRLHCRRCACCAACPACCSRCSCRACCCCGSCHGGQPRLVVVQQLLSQACWRREAVVHHCIHFVHHKLLQHPAARQPCVVTHGYRQPVVRKVGKAVGRGCRRLAVHRVGRRHGRIHSACICGSQLPNQPSIQPPCRPTGSAQSPQPSGWPPAAAAAADRPLPRAAPACAATSGAPAPGNLGWLCGWRRTAPGTPAACGAAAAAQTAAPPAASCGRTQPLEPRRRAATRRRRGRALPPAAAPPSAPQSASGAAGGRPAWMWGRESAQGKVGGDVRLGHSCTSACTNTSQAA